MRLSAALLLSGATLGTVAAGGCDLGAPSAAITVSPLEGRAPLEIRLDASGSAAFASDGLRYRFDIDGDGSWDTEPSADPEHSGVIERAGAFQPRVEVTTRDGRVGVAVSADTVRVTAAMADLDADASRDGLVDEDDKADEDVWTDARGGVFLSNWDDDDSDGSRDARDEWMNGSADQLDMAPLIARRSPDLPAGARVHLELSPAEAAARVRVFSARDLLIDLDEGRAELPVQALREGDVELFLEGVGGRSGLWDGRVRVTLTAQDGDDVLGSDSVELRAAPTIFPDNTQAAERLYVMRISSQELGENLPFYDALADGLPAEVPLYAVDQYDYYGDRWLQDNMQTGYQRVPAGDGVHMQLNYLETERMTGYGLEQLIPSELLGGDFGFAYTGGAESSLNYGGNLEVAPPHEAGGERYRFGRVFVGGGDAGTILGAAHADHMNPDQLGYLDAQEVQGPVFELSSEWLAVGHIDEVLLFVPDLQRSERPWRVVIASPSLARRELLRVEGLGAGDAVIFAGRETETTVAGILSDEDLLAYNDAVQARIDSIRERLSDEMELSDADFIEVPVLFEPLYYGGQDFGIALSPGMQNLVVVDDQLFIPDPEGPDVIGKDAWQQAAVEGLAPTGVEVTFVDVFESYHLLMGEAHCGTNVQHAPYAEEWWTP